MKMTKRIEFCDDCGTGYWKPFWEPMFLARRAWSEAHFGAHTNPENHRTVMLWREFERERIIALLEEAAAINHGDGEFFMGAQGKHSRTFAEAYESAIALIKGENK